MALAGRREKGIARVLTPQSQLIGDLPSGKRLHTYGKSPLLMGKTTN